MVNSRQRKTLKAIFTDPIQPNIRWADIEGLLGALGANLTEGQGSRVRVTLEETRWVFHRPHPETTAGKARIRDVRSFLQNAGVSDADI